ncbi:MAG: DUF177 domain-containing protein [Candidatus Hadarchaeum sp.]
MKFNVAQQLKEGVGSVRNYDIDATDDEGHLVRGKIQFLRTNRSILVTGTLETNVTQECSRCLEQFDYYLELNIEEEFFLTIDPISGLPLPPPAEAGAFLIDENHILDLGEAVRQYEVMALPMKPVCRQICAGLCPQCGRNLNYGACDCPANAPDPRWAKLESLRTTTKRRGRKKGVT